MAYEAKPNTGIIGANKRKEQPNHPDISGSINIDGKDYWLSGWKKSNASGTFYSLAAKPKDAASRPARDRGNAPPADFSDFGNNDDLPF